MNLKTKDALTVAWLAGLWAAVPGATLAAEQTAVGFTGTPAGRVLSDADMPRVETLKDTDDYSVFMSPGVSEPLRLQALRKLFHSAACNRSDGLANYAEDYSTSAIAQARLEDPGKHVAVSTMH
jgi:Protein of unknown function (DUF3306)